MIPLTTAELEINVESSASRVSLDYHALINSVNMTTIKQHVQFFSSLQTRATGYAENILASQYIYDKFIEYNLENVTYHNFDVVDAISYGANITLHFADGTEKTIQLHPILPNNVVPSVTPPNGLEGKLIYAGEGFITDFPKENVSGSIVLMDWYSENNWINAAKLGAKAVIFLPSKSYLCDAYGNRIVKFLPDIPLYFPRFYVEDGSLLLKNLGCKATVRSDVRWEKVTGKNVMGWIKGTKWPDDIIMLTAHYDSYSYAPTFAPGAQESTGVAALLEFAKYFSDHKPARTILFIAYGAHHQALEGARFWHYDYLKPQETLEERMKGPGKDFWYKILLQLNLDFSTGSNIVSFTGISFLYGLLVSSDTIDVYVCDFMRKLVDEINRETGKSYRLIVGSHRNSPATYSSQTAEPCVSSYKYFTHDSEPQVDSGPNNGISFITTLDSRPYYYTPFDTIDKISDEGFSNLKTQLELVRCSVISLIENEAPISAIKGSFRPPTYWSGHRLEYSLKGQVAIWDPTTDWYKPVPNALVYVTVGAYHGDYPHNRRFTLADHEGNFEFKYGFSSTAYGIGGTTVKAWVVNSSGNILFGPDSGIHMYRSPNIAFAGPVQKFDMGFLTVCEASTMMMFDVVDPERLGLPQDEETGSYFTPSARIYETASGIPLISGGSWMPQAGLGILYCVVPPETLLEIGVYRQAETYPFTVLTSASSENFRGSGYKLKQGEQLRLLNGPINYAENLYYLNEERFGVLKSSNPEEAETEAYKIHQETKVLIEEAKNALKTFEYAKAYNLAHIAWINERRIYVYARTRVEDSVNVILMLSLFLVPFVLVVEKLAFSLEGRNRIIPIILVFVLVMAALYVLHPGFRTTANPVVVVIGISTFILTMPILWVIYTKTAKLYRELREKILGKHIVDVARSSAAMYSFQIGVENMKKARFRSILTLLSIIIMVSGVISLVSIGAMEMPRAFEVRGNNLYEGVYIHKLEWGHGRYALTGRLVDFISTRYGDQAIITPRAWLYTVYATLFRPPVLDNFETEYKVSFKAYYNQNFLQVKAMLGLTPQESEVSQIGAFLITGRWFEPTDRQSCILTENQAKKLGIKVEDLPVKIMVEGVPFHVVAIISPKYSLVGDIDGEELTPIVLDYEGTNPYNVHYYADDILILQYVHVINLGGDCASISLKPYDKDLIPQLAAKIFNMFPYQVFSSIGGKIYINSRGLAFSFQRWEFAIAPMAIVVLSISNILMGAVYERRNLIRTYASLGLSPFHIGFMFFAEAVVYSIVGGIFAYLTALIQMRAATLIPGTLPLNFSSSLVIMALAVSMATTVISAILPSLIASRMVTPSLERAWKIPTSPVMDKWEIPMPFTSSSRKETNAIMEYLKEYFEAHLGEEALEFAVRDLRIIEGEEEGKTFIEISAETRLHPYELGVMQAATLRMTETKQEMWNLRCLLYREGGNRSEWIKLNRKFLNLIREQLLLWRALLPTEKEKYMK